MKLYHFPGSRSLRVLWLVEEMGLTASLLGLGDAMPPAVLDHQARMAERPAYQRAAARQP